MICYTLLRGTLMKTEKFHPSSVREDKLSKAVISYSMKKKKKKLKAIKRIMRGSRDRALKP